MHCLVVFANSVFSVAYRVWIAPLPCYMLGHISVWSEGLFGALCDGAAAENQLSTIFRKIHFLLLASGFWVFWN